MMSVYKADKYLKIRKNVKWKKHNRQQQVLIWKPLFQDSHVR